VTPSDTVDQAWHLHLIYTGHYWEELCGKVLGLQLHHEPSAGGAVEGGKYEQTIILRTNSMNWIWSNFRTIRST